MRFCPGAAGISTEVPGDWCSACGVGRTPIDTGSALMLGTATSALRGEGTVVCVTVLGSRMKEGEDWVVFGEMF